MDYDIQLDNPNTTIYKDRVTKKRKAARGINDTIADKIAKAGG